MKPNAFETFATQFIGMLVYENPTIILALIAAYEAQAKRIAELEAALTLAEPWVEAGPAGSWREGVLAKVRGALRKGGDDNADA